MIRSDNDHKPNSIETISIRKINSVTQKLEALNRIARVVLREFKAIKPKNTRSSSDTRLNFYHEVKRFEIELILFALDQTGGNQRAAAEMLELNPTTLNSMLRRHNIVYSAKPES